MKKEVVAYLNTTSQNFLGGTEEYYEIVGRWIEICVRRTEHEDVLKMYLRIFGLRTGQS